MRDLQENEGHLEMMESLETVASRESLDQWEELEHPVYLDFLELLGSRDPRVTPALQALREREVTQEIMELTATLDHKEDLYVDQTYSVPQQCY